MSLLSIVIPAYNADRFIENTLTTIVSEQADDIEVIVVNDGSVDNTKQIVEKFCKTNSYIKLINQENKGESGARNAGIKAATGDYIYFLDCDDSIMPGTLNHFLETIKAEYGKSLYCFSYVSKVNGEISKYYTAPKLDRNTFSDKISFLKAYLSKHLPCHICSVVTKKSIIKDNNLQFIQGLKIGADIQFLLELFLHIESAYYSNRVCYIYQIRDDSIMQGYKTYSRTQYNAFALRRDTLLSESYQCPELKKYSYFWIQNQLLSNIVYYVRSDFKDDEITSFLINDCNLLRKSIIKGKGKHYYAILAAKFIPLKVCVKLIKR